MKSKILIKENSTKSRDPYILFLNHLYYYCFSRDDKIYISVSDQLEGLNDAKEYLVYENKEELKNIWAPEIHSIDGKCYIYVACDDGNNENHRMYVLYNNSSDPLEKYKNYGVICDASNKWAIDGTIFEYKNEMYFIWSGCDQDIHYKQELFIAKMKSPFKLCSEKVLLSTPEYDWEMQGGDGKSLPYVNEGPAILKTESRTFLVYSASGCWCEHYCLGLLEFIGKDPLLKQSWKKYTSPIFSSTNEIIGPGHCCFIEQTDKNNKEIYMIFHSFNDKKNLDLANVSARYKKIVIKNDFPILDKE